jgi:hypothetical protein
MKEPYKNVKVEWVDSRLILKLGAELDILLLSSYPTIYFMALILQAYILLGCSIVNWFTFIIYKGVDTINTVVRMIATVVLLCFAFSLSVFGIVKIFHKCSLLSLSLSLCLSLSQPVFESRICVQYHVYTVFNWPVYRNLECIECIIFYTALQLMTIVKVSYWCITNVYFS